MSISGYSVHPLVAKLERVVSLYPEERLAVEKLPILVRIIPARQDIVREGDHTAQSCLILDGWSFRYKLLDEGKRQILAFHVAGDMPDLLSVQMPVMDHSLRTLATSTIATIPHSDIKQLTASFPRLGSALWRETLVDSAIFREWVVNVGRRSAYQRIAHLLCEIFTKLQAVGRAALPECALPLLQDDIADATGLSAVHVNRTLTALRDNGVATLSRGRLHIPDWPGLQVAARFNPSYLHLPSKARSAAG